MFHHLSASVIIRHHARSGSGLERPTIVGKNGALNPCRERASEAVRCAHRARILLRLTATQRGAREVEAMSLRSLHAPRWVAVKRFACGRRPHWETGMAGSCNWRVRILFGVLVCLMSSARADQSEVAADRPPRHDRPPRKVVVGTTMTRWYSNYPGLDGRIEQMHGLIDQLAAESRAKYGRSIDVALFSEYAITAGKQGTAAEIAVLLDDKIIDAFAAKAREHNTHIVFGGVFFDRPGSSSCSNAAVVIDRQGRLVGRYDKVHPVLDRAGPEGRIVLEGGVRPGAEYNLFELDFGRVGVQICYDVEYPEGWRRLGRKGRRTRSVSHPVASAHPPRHVRRDARILGRVVHVPQQRFVFRAGNGARRRPDHRAEADAGPRDRPQLSHPSLVAATAERRGVPAGFR
jgi:hypothetical protein